jgi:hypothetical protein
MVEMINGTSSADDVIYAIKGIENSLSVNTLASEIKDLEENISRYREKSKLNKNIPYRDMYLDFIMEGVNKKIVIEEAVKGGFVNFIRIGFGDNAGIISGGRIGTTMDYEGRGINIHKPDFIVTTEQNR